MTSEQRFFIRVLADHLQERETAMPGEALDWDELLTLGKIHQVGGILYVQCQSFLPEELEEPLSREHATALFYNANREVVAAGLWEALRKEQIPFFIVKGAAVAAYYPVKDLRTMGDTDFVVHTEDRLRAHEILLSQGFKNESRFEDREWVYYINQMEFELHDHLVYSESINRSDHERFFNDFWPYYRDGELDWSFHLLFLLLHLRKHLMNEGVGFRQFMDVAAVSKNCSTLNWTWIAEKLGELGMLDFARTVFALNAAWFGVETPIPGKVLDESFLEEATALVLRNGVFGYDNAENRDNATVNAVRGQENTRQAMSRSAIRKVFPAYEAMIVVPHYSFLKGKPWLLPAAWLYRFLLGVKRNKVSRAVHAVRASYISEETLQKRSAMLDQWGL